MITLMILAAAPALAAPAGVVPLPDGAVCETVAWPVYGEDETPERVLRATAGGLVVVDRASNTSRTLTTCDGLPATHALAVAALPDGAAAVAFRGLGIHRVDPDTGASAPIAADVPELAWATALAFHDGRLVAGTVSHGVYALWPDGGSWKATRPWKRWREGRVSALVVDQATDTLYVGRDLAGLWTLDGKGKERRLLKGSVQALRMEDGRLLVDRGVEVCAKAVGETRCRPVASAPVQPSDLPEGSLPSNHLTTLAVHPGPDGEPRLWAGTFDRGVVVREGDRWVRPHAEGEPPRFVNQLVSHGTDLWAATPHGAYLLRDGRWRRYGEMAGLPTDRVNAVHVAADGGVWFGTSFGLTVWDRRGFRTLSTADGLPHRIVHAVTTVGGLVYAGTTDGLAVIDGDQVRTLRLEHGTLSGNWVTALATLPTGAVLAGTYDAGVDAVTERGGAFVEQLGRVWVNPNGLVVDPETGALYVATLGDGLWERLPGGAVRHHVGLPSDDVTAVTRFGGHLWIATRSGLLRR
jgi:ligand-binding sensor domain-containing protein